MSEDHECEECEEGAPAWLATFADLMSLLMCFFVLLLSFSEMDLRKYKQVAGSMNMAFGVQRKIKSDTIPRGTSIIKQEFSPGKPEPTVMRIIEQDTVDDNREEIRINTPISEEMEDLISKIEMAYSEEINEEIIDVVLYEDSVMIRVREADAFPSGKAELEPEFFSVLDKLSDVLNKTDGRVIVAGHTDNIPISNDIYGSNWVLSAARSASVVHHLAENVKIEPSRLEIRAFSDTKPITNNDTAENRAINRRIEINITLGSEEE
ncbi:MAG: flagellar motor protein MotB [Granulosicoccus sp.]